MYVRGIRGAITVDSNTEIDISNQTKKLIDQIILKNSLKQEDIVSIIFTATADLNAAYPAATVRQMGIQDVPLMCMQEMKVAGSLEKCLRVLLLVNTDKKNSEICHVYLEGAKILRPDLATKDVEKIRIAIDGPAGAGKSTIAKILSKRMNLRYLDTGAMYRTVALKAIKNNVDTLDRCKISEMIKSIDIKVVFDNGVQKMYLDGVDVTECIRTKEVTIGSSNVATIPEVRLKLVELQREIAREQGIVMDGRDIGTYVIPDAELKIFLVASPEERARRRYKEMIAKGEVNISFEAVMKDIEYRDKNDSSREMAPLKKADDAIEINTTNMSIDEVVDKIISLVKGI